jgi:adenylate kinase family enzyme
MAKLIIVQGMSCLGKTTLCKEIVQNLSDSIHLSVDAYKERLWDEQGFSSEQHRENLSKQAKKEFIIDIQKLIDENNYKYILIDYVFINDFWNTIENLINKNKDRITVCTIYLQPERLSDHKNEWERRSRDFTIRHPGHGAKAYNKDTRVGTEYINRYSQKIFLDKLPTLGNTLDINVKFRPQYKLNKNISEIIEFIRDE